MLVADSRAVNEQLETVPWRHPNLEQAAEVFGRCKLLCIDRPATRILVDAGGIEGRSGLHHGHP